MVLNYYVTILSLLHSVSEKRILISIKKNYLTQLNRQLSPPHKYIQPIYTHVYEMEWKAYPKKVSKGLFDYIYVKFDSFYIHALISH